jgi:hypothetical protein
VPALTKPSLTRLTYRATVDVPVRFRKSKAVGAVSRSCFRGAEKILAKVFQKAEFWKTHAAVPINERSARHAQPAAQWIRGQANLVQMGDDRETLA